MRNASSSLARGSTETSSCQNLQSPYSSERSHGLVTNQEGLGQSTARFVPTGDGDGFPFLPTMTGNQDRIDGMARRDRSIPQVLMYSVSANQTAHAGLCARGCFIRSIWLNTGF